MKTTKNIQKILVITSLFFIMPFSSFAIGNGQGKNVAIDNQQMQMLNISSLPVEELSDEEREGLSYMIEEERLARDVYKTLYEKYKLNVFNNIPQSEQRHIDAVEVLVNRYEIEYNANNEEKVGVFENEKLQGLYNDLVAKGEKSLIDALEVGATIEDVDIYDIKEYLEKVDNQDIRMVYENLIAGSENHLRAFNRQLEMNGADSYKAQFITQLEVDEILAGTNGNAVQGQGMNNNVINTPNTNALNVQVENNRGFFGRIWNFFKSLF